MLQAFKNKNSLKQQVITRMKQHIKLDQLVQGIGYDNTSGKGCGVGCSIDCYDHQSFANTLDVDIWIPQMYDTLHEGIHAKDIAKFNINFLNSIQVGMTTKQSAWRPSCSSAWSPCWARTTCRPGNSRRRRWWPRCQTRCSPRASSW